MANKIFDLDVQKATFMRFEENILVAHLKEIRKADRSSNKNNMKSLKTEIRASIESDLLSQFGESLRNKYGVTINQRIIDQMFPSSPNQ